MSNLKENVSVMLANTAPVAIAELEPVKQKFIQNYNATHKEKVGEMMYHRQVLHFKQLVANSTDLANADKFTLYACFLTAAVNGWSFDPMDNEVYMLALKGKACLWPQAGARVRKLIDSQQVKFTDQAKIVYEGDDFVVENGRVVKHNENFKSEKYIAAYVRFVLPGGGEKYFIYRVSDWMAWKKKSSQGGGDNWTGNNGQPLAAFLRTKVVKHAALDRSWATGNSIAADAFNVVVEDEQVETVKTEDAVAEVLDQVQEPVGELQEQDANDNPYNF